MTIAPLIKARCPPSSLGNGVDHQWCTTFQGKRLQHDLRATTHSARRRPATMRLPQCRSHAPGMKARQELPTQESVDM